MDHSPSPVTARTALASWRRCRPDNFYESDSDLRRVVRLYLGPERLQAFESRFNQAGADAATVVAQAADVNDRPHNHPQLERWAPTGERIESVEFHPSYHTAGRPIYESGILAIQAKPGRAFEQAVLLYLFGQCGEAGHLCPVVCTAGLIRVLQRYGSADLRERYLPPLLDPRYEHRQTGAQSLTEIQGGSDVGANVVCAMPEPGQEGAWRITGEKWFFSNATAEQILVTAHPEGARSGSRGLGLFLVPRYLPDGSLNEIYLRRLKTKFGTRSMASAEVDFRGALAYQVGPVEKGIHIVLEQVLNTSRWLNAVGSLALLRRGYLEARCYALHREAFGARISEYPLVQEALAEMRVDLAGGLAATWRLTDLVNRIDEDVATVGERALFRLLVNLNKYRTSIVTSRGLRRAQEIFGGNGAIEDFSVVPRLYRDAVVYESWEGSHNVLCVQLLRDMQRYRIHDALFEYFRSALASVHSSALDPYVQELLVLLADVEQRIEHLLEGEALVAQAHIRRVLDFLAPAVEASCILLEADGARREGLEPVPEPLLEYFFNRWLRPGYDPLEDVDYLERLALLL